MATDKIDRFLNANKNVLDYLKTRKPRRDRTRQTKLYLSESGFARLQAASVNSDLSMSAIVDILLAECLTPGASRLKPRRVATTPKKEFTLD